MEHLIGSVEHGKINKTDVAMDIFCLVGCVITDLSL